MCCNKKEMYYGCAWNKIRLSALAQGPLLESASKITPKPSYAQVLSVG